MRHRRQRHGGVDGPDAKPAGRLHDAWRGPTDPGGCRLDPTHKELLADGDALVTARIDGDEVSRAVARPLDDVLSTSDTHGRRGHVVGQRWRAGKCQRLGIGLKHGGRGATLRDKRGRGGQQAACQEDTNRASHEISTPRRAAGRTAITETLGRLQLGEPHPCVREVLALLELLHKAIEVRQRFRLLIGPGEGFREEEIHTVSPGIARIVTENFLEPVDGPRIPAGTVVVTAPPDTRPRSSDLSLPATSYGPRRSGGFRDSVRRRRRTRGWRPW